MANKSITPMQEVSRVAVGEDKYGTYYLILSREVVSQSIANNSSVVKLKLSLYCPVWINTVRTTLVIGDSSVNIGPSWSAGTNEIWNNGDGWTLGHAPNGKLDYTFTASINSTYLLNGTVSGKITVPDIPRYTTVSQSFVEKTETTIGIKWTATDTVDHVWYSKNNGSTWIDAGAVNGTSGTYTISGLSPNTAYNIKTRVRRKDSQLTSDTSTLAVTTYKTVTQSLNSKAETSITINWVGDSEVDYIWYQLNNGSLVAVGSTSASSGTYTINGLSANTIYNVKTVLRRKNAGTSFYTSSLAVTTYNYPYITAINTSNLIIGNSQKLTLYNPLKRNVTIGMRKDNSTGTLLYSGTTTGTTLTFTPTASTLYNSIPNSQNANCVYTCTYSSVTNITGVNKYTINTNNCIPTFNDFTYADTGSMTDLTGNNQLLVNGYSTCTFTVSTTNKAVAKNGASIVKYKFEWGSKSSEANYSASANVSSSIANSTTGVLKVTAIDSRGLSKAVTKNITVIPYVDATMNSLATQRKNGVDVETYLSFNATLWNGNWNASSNNNYANQLKYVGYRVHNGSAWTSYFDITTAVKNAIITSKNGNIITLNLPFSKNIAIHANGSDGGFEIGKAYKIQVYIRDGISSVTFNPSTYYATLQADVTDGKVGLSRYKGASGNYHYGINGMPSADDTLIVHGNLKTNDNIDLHKKDTDGTTGYKQGGDIVLLHNEAGATVVAGTGNNLILRPLGVSNTNVQVCIDKDGIVSILTTASVAYIKMKGNTTIADDGKNSAISAHGGNIYFNPNGDGNTTGQARLSNVGTFITEKLNGKFRTYETNPTQWTNYRIPFASLYDNNTYANFGNSNGIEYSLQEGTASIIGTSKLMLGNSIPQGTAGNKYGRLQLYSFLKGAISIQPSNTDTNKTIYLPAVDCTLAPYPVNLYNNASGATGTVTLSQSAANFAYLEIFYGKDGQESQKIYSPNGKSCRLIEATFASTVFQTVSKNINISGTSITVSNYGYGNINSNGTCSIASENTIKIYRVNAIY